MAVPSYRFIAPKLAVPSAKTRAPISTIKPSSVSLGGLTPKSYSLLLNNRTVKDILKNDLNIVDNKSTKAFSTAGASDSTNIDFEDILNRLRILRLIELLRNMRARKLWNRVSIPLKLAGYTTMAGAAGLQLYNAMRIGDAVSIFSDPLRFQYHILTNVVSPILRRLGIRDDLTVLQAFTRRYLPPIKSKVKAGISLAGSKALQAGRSFKAGYNTFRDDVNKAKEYAEKKVSTTNDHFKKYLLGLLEELNNPTLRKVPYQSPTLYDYPQ